MKLAQNYLQYHSLAQLLVELLLIKIVTVTPNSQSQFRDRFSSDIDEKFNSANNDESDEEKKQHDPTEGMTDQEKIMHEVLCQKK